MIETNATVRLDRQQHRLLVQPAPTGLLDRLQSIEHVAVTDRQRGSHLQAVPRRLYAPPADDGIGDHHAGAARTGLTMAGLEPVAAQLLQESGYRIRRRAGRHLPAPAVDRLPEDVVVDEPLLQLLRQHERGLVRYGPPVRLTRLIAQIGLAYPHLSIALAAATVAEARASASVLRRWFREDVACARPDKIRSHPSRIVVGTYTGLMGGCLDIHRRNLVIALDAVEVLGKRGVELLSAALNARLLGFLPLGRQLALRDADHLRCFFGFEEAHVPAHGYQPLPVDVVCERMAGGNRLPADLTGVALRRRALWRNGLFQRRVAKLARAIHTGNRKGRFEYVMPAAGDRGNRVAVLVENAEHGVALAKQLPGCRMVTGPHVDLKGMNRASRETFAAATRHSGEDVPAIYTLAAADQLDPRRIDVLIRADAGQELPPIRDDLLMLPNSDDHRLLLVDFDDRRHHELGRLTRRRKRTYRERGWYAPGADPLEERVKDFLANRPSSTQA